MIRIIVEVLILINISILCLRYVGFDLRNVNSFGDDKDSPELVTKLFTEDELKEAPTHSRKTENLFGIEDSIITRFRAYSHDLLPDPEVFAPGKQGKLLKGLRNSRKSLIQNSQL